MRSKDKPKANNNEGQSVKREQEQHIVKAKAHNKHTQEDEAKNIQMAKKLHAYKERLFKEQENQGKQRFTGVKKKGGIDQVIPTYREVYDSLELLKSTIPNQDVKSVIKSLYKSLIEKTADGQANKKSLSDMMQLKQMNNEKTETKRTSMCQIDNNIRALGDIGDDEGVVIHFARELTVLKRYSSKEEQEKYDYKRLVAQSMCNKQYGIAAFQQQITEKRIKVNIDRERYKTHAYSIATESYRRFQKFLIEECKVRIKTIDQHEMRLLYSVLVNFKKYFSDENIATFVKFIKLVYGLQTVMISELESKRLYISIQQMFRLRLTDKLVEPIYGKSYVRNGDQNELPVRLHSKYEAYELHKMWKKEYEAELLSVYKHHQHFREIRQYFKQIFPNMSQLFTIDALRSKFYKIMRATLRKIDQFSHNPSNDIPAMIKLNDTSVKHVLRSADGLHVRLKLIDFACRQEWDKKMLIAAIIAINQYVTMKDKQRLQVLSGAVNDDIGEGTAVVDLDDQQVVPANVPPISNSRGDSTNKIAFSKQAKSVIASAYDVDEDCGSFNLQSEEMSVD